VDGLALIFFMGLGDYMMATAMLEALRLAHPNLLIYAYASSSNDAANSALLINLLRANPMIDRVYSYRGRPGSRWVDYDFRDALRNIPENFLILPVVYETIPGIAHRETALLETFGLPIALPVRGPILCAGSLTENANIILAEIRERVEASAAHRIICCHFGARSSGYVYPHANALVRRLLGEGCLVINFAKSDIADSNLLDIDVTTITPNDTICLLRALKEQTLPLYIVSVNSLMWPISAGLGVKNLGLHVFFDESVHQYLYPNIFVISQHNYHRIPASRLFLAPIGSYEQTLPSKSGTTFTNYDPEFVSDCFLRFVDMS
jgi:hypothetical protein